MLHTHTHTHAFFDVGAAAQHIHISPNVLRNTMNPIKSLHYSTFSGSQLVQMQLTEVKQRLIPEHRRHFDAGSGLDNKRFTLKPAYVNTTWSDSDLMVLFYCETALNQLFFTQIDLFRDTFSTLVILKDCRDFDEKHSIQFNPGGESQGGHQIQY